MSGFTGIVECGSISFVVSCGWIDVGWECFKSVICFVFGLGLYISRVLVSHYNLERSWFQGLLFYLFISVACLCFMLCCE